MRHSHDERVIDANSILESKNRLKLNNGIDIAGNIIDYGIKFY